jgi:hypothetical protein
LRWAWRRCGAALDIIQSVRAVFSTEAVAHRGRRPDFHQSRLGAGDARLIDRRLAGAGVIQQTESIETPTMVGRPTSRLWRGWRNCERSSPAFRYTARSNWNGTAREMLKNKGVQGRNC